MRDRRAAIDNDPLAVVFTLDAGLGKTGIAHRIAHTGGKCFGLAVGGAGSDDHALEKRRDVLRVKHLDILRFHVLQPVDDGALQFLDVFFAFDAGGFDRG